MDKTIKQIDGKIRILEAQKARYINRKVVPEIIRQMRQGGVTPKDIIEAWGTGGHSQAKPKRKTALTADAPRPAKYKNPETGETWGGFGKRPFWLRDAEQAGHRREEFLIGEPVRDTTAD